MFAKHNHTKFGDKHWRLCFGAYNGVSDLIVLINDNAYVEQYAKKNNLKYKISMQIKSENERQIGAQTMFAKIAEESLKV